MPDEATLPDWAPTPAGVAALLWEHTRDSQNTAGEGGVLVDEPRMGQFTEHTTPSLALVNQLIAQACGDMAGLLEGHEPCRKSLVLGIRGATTYLAAALAEQAREPQAAAGEGSPYNNLYALWIATGPKIAARVVASCPYVPDPDDPEVPDGASGMLGPVARVPCHPDRVTWWTEF